MQWLKHACQACARCTRVAVARWRAHVLDHDCVEGPCTQCRKGVHELALLCLGCAGPLQGDVLVWGVDVLIIPCDSRALIRSHNDIHVKRVDMQGSTMDEMLRFGPFRLSKERATFLT
jgi:hypothetical protein